MSVARSKLKKNPHPIAQLRVAFSELEGTSRYLRPLVRREEIFTNILPTAQASLRWSTTSPPLTNFPAELRDGTEELPGKLLRDPWVSGITLPHPGTWWLKFDWQAVEARLEALLSEDQEELAFYVSGQDIHSRTCVRVFGWDTIEGRYAYVKDLPNVSRDILRTALLDQTGQDLLAAMQAQDFHQGVPPVLVEWQESLRAPCGNESWPGRNCSPHQWRQARQQTRELDSDDESGTRSFAYAAWIVCGGPPIDWSGGEDRRRHNTKTVRYALTYSPDERGILESEELIAIIGRESALRLARSYISARPLLSAMKRRLGDVIAREGVARTGFGHPRQVYRRGPRPPGDLDGTRDMRKEGIAHTISGTVSVMGNLSAIRVQAAFPEAYIVRNDHDSQTWAFPTATAIDHVMAAVRPIVEGPWLFPQWPHIPPFKFPASWTWCDDKGNRHKI